MTYQQIAERGFYWYRHKPDLAWTIFWIEQVKGKWMAEARHPLEHLTGEFRGPLQP